MNTTPTPRLARANPERSSLRYVESDVDINCQGGLLVEATSTIAVHDYRTTNLLASAHDDLPLRFLGYRQCLRAVRFELSPLPHASRAK